MATQKERAAVHFLDLRACWASRLANRFAMCVHSIGSRPNIINRLISAALLAHSLFFFSSKNKKCGKEKEISSLLLPFSLTFYFHLDIRLTVSRQSSARHHL
ncbi:hypothetical protein OUZ56_001440 [Daphnia magna]|uniref:Uncharacterized protein n=1 Tax=Daphnia magna TaxID=35525 RepID=A0ABR0A396_9CRUS|nr:hypothetical protein OUZ56_001440 [Daphnia magna]